MTILIFILVLGILVLVHELGHFFAALKAGCDVEEFGIGFPPRVFKKKHNGILYSINLLPIGGYVKIKGENGGEQDDPGSFSSKSLGWKALIVSAGVIMNIALAYVLISITLMFGRPSVISDQDFGRFANVKDEGVYITQVLEGSPAEKVGIEPGSEVIRINDIPVESVAQMSDIFNAESEGTEFQFTYTTEDDEKTTTISTYTIEEIEKQGIGVGLVETGIVSYPFYIAPFVGISETAKILGLIVIGLGDLLKNLVSTGAVGADVAGPIGIAVLTGEVAQQGIVPLLMFAAMLSLNLAIINILPFPGLDGSRLLFIVIEKLRGKQMNFKVEALLNLVGFGLLMLLMVIVTIKDIRQYGQSLIDFIF